MMSGHDSTDRDPSNSGGTISMLLIEDNPADARIFQEQFKSAKRNELFDRVFSGSGFTDVEFTHETSIENGTARLRNEQFDIVILDLQLPDSDGIETVDAVVGVDATVPIVVLTGMPEQRLGADAVAKGAQDYLVKGELSPEMVLLTVQYAIERKKTERKLRQRSDQLAILNRLTRHDVRNDVSLIVGRASELTEYVDPRGQEILEEIKQSGNHILELTATIGDALDAIAEDSISVTSVELAPLLRDEVEKANALYGDAEITIGSVPDVSVKANRLLSSVVSNLINNGVFYNDKETPTVRVEAEADAETVTIEVADNGPGIPKPQRQAVFSEEMKGAESTGLGVGLTLAHRLVTQYGGEIDVTENEPEGSIFVVTLQRA